MVQTSRIAVPLWIWGGGAFVALWPVALLFPGVDALPVAWVAVALRLAIEGAAHLWSSHRRDLPARLRLTLRITGWTSLVSSVTVLPIIVASLGGPDLLDQRLDAAWTLASYVLGSVALLVYPRRKAPGDRFSLPIDVLITTGGLGVLQWTLVTAPSAAAEGWGGLGNNALLYGVAQLVYFLGLNVVFQRGAALPSSRAFCWFVTGQTMYLPVVFFQQIQLPFGAESWLGGLSYFAGVVPTLIAAVYIRRDALETQRSSRPIWLVRANPLPMFVGCGLGIALVLALVRQQSGNALVFAIALATIAVLIALRLSLTTRQNSRLLRAKAESERRHDSERRRLVGQLAGGIAHEFNNQLTGILGSASFELESAGASQTRRKNLERILLAGERVARLTKQLERFSGQQIGERTLSDLATVLATQRESLQRTLGPDVRLEIQSTRTAQVHLDPDQFSAVMEELAANARAAMPAGGSLSIRLDVCDLTDGSEGAGLRVGPGRYATIEVTDTGCGMGASEVTHSFEPFFSSDPNPGAGMGLAAVYGTMASHHGGIRLDSRLTVGTTVTLYFPLADLRRPLQSSDGSNSSRLPALGVADQSGRVANPRFGADRRSSRVGGS